jgi:hypothetical protein
MEKRTKLSNLQNNIVYVEPNYVSTSLSEYGVNGLNTYELTPDLEDYSIFVNLEVEIRGRNVQSSKSATGKRLVLSFISNTDGTSSVNFMQGSKIPIGDNGATMNSLTTNYTDIFLSDIKKNGPSSELFGIESIDIAYNNYMVPEVTIEFVDVRGVALFAQREYNETRKNIDAAIDSNNKEDIANSFFQCFFTFPYPKFTLLVKGFYGQPVSYELTCADFRARFDSRTGNFACTAKFVGYHFSFLNDAMMNGLVAAPYSDYIGSDYWESRHFSLKGTDGNDVPMPKIGELLGKMKKFEKLYERSKQSSPEAFKKNTLDEKIGKYKDIGNTYNNFVNQINLFINNESYVNDKRVLIDTSNGYMRSAVFLTPNGNGEDFQTFVKDNEKKISGFYEGFLEQLQKFNEEYPNEQLPIPDKFYEVKPFNRIEPMPNDETKATVEITTNNVMKENHPLLYDNFKAMIDGENTGNTNPLLNYRSVYYYNDNGFVDKLEEYQKANSDELKSTEEEIEKLRDTAVSVVLGFHPTVENMTKIVMAHFEVFARMILETAKTICNQEPKRTMSSLGVNDMRAISDVSNKDKSPDTVVPPFPKVTGEVRRENSTIREEMWVGDYPGDFREKDLVHGLINGVNAVREYVDKYESADNSDNTAGSDTPVSTKMKFPLTPLDMVADSKPYKPDGFDANDVSSVVGLVGLRAVQALGTINFAGWNEKADILGRAEAYNFLLDNTVSKELGQKLSAISEDDIFNMMTGSTTGAIQKPNNGSGPWPWRVNPNGGGIISSDGNLDICRTGEGGFVVPYQNLSWPKIKEEIINSKNAIKAVASNDYINTKADSLFANDNLFTVDTNHNRIAKIAEKTLVNIEGIEYYRKKYIDEGKYTEGKYSHYLDTGHASTVIAYIIENAKTLIPKDGSCMLPPSKEAIYKDCFGKGYNMNKFHNYEPGDGSNGGWVDKDENDIKRKCENGYGDYMKNFNYLDFVFTEFPGVHRNMEPHTAAIDGKPLTSIFGQYLYYRETSRRVRAMLFLASMGYVINHRAVIANMCNKQTTIMVVPLPSILFAGALIWSETVDGKKAMKYCNTGGYRDEITLLTNNLRSDVQKKLMYMFNHWVEYGIEGDSILKSFKDIQSGMELTLVHKGDGGKTRTFYEFFSNIGEIEDEKPSIMKIFGGSKQTWFKRYDNSYKTVSDFLYGELGDDFFRNYITIDEDANGDIKDGTRGIRLGIRDGGPSSMAASNLALAGCVFVKNSKYFNDNSITNVNVDPGALKLFFKGFLEIVKQQDFNSNTSVSEQISQALDPNDTNEDIKIGIYRYCKMIYDKWIAGLSDEDFEKQWTVDSFFESEQKYFYFIDAYYNVMDFIPLNVGDFCDQIVSCYRNEQYSLLSFLSSIYAKNKMNFICVQNFIDLGKKANMESMFDPVPYTDVWEIKRHPNFIVMYPYESSNYLADIDNSEYENDGFMLNQPNSTDNIWPEPLTSRNANASIRYNIPAFGVSYGKMYQSYFKDIDVSMDSPTVTEQSIKAQFAIASQHNEGEQTGDRATTYTYGQDLYSIYSNNSYTCNVTMMGCAWVQPLMYFVLNNIPMFRGTYLIQKVNHHIEPGNMTTKFTGVRMSNVCTRIARYESVRARNDQTGNDYGDEPSPMQKLASVDNDCPYKEYPLVVEGGDIQLSGEKFTDGSRIMKSIMARGYSKAQAAGIVGNMMQESSLNPKKVVCDSKGYYSGGLCMWHSQALIALTKMDSSHVGDPTYSGVLCSTGRGKEIENQLPSVSDQVKFLLDSFENDSVFKNWGIKRKLMAETTPEGAAVVFQNEFERCAKTYCEEGLRKKYAREFFDNYRENDNAQIAKNKDGHISDLATGFLNALNKTAAASSNGNVSIGIDSNRSSGDVLLLTNANNSDKFSTVLDMILSAYSSKVKTVCWVLPGDGQNIHAVPKYYLVNVNEGSNAVSVLVTTEDDLPRNINNESVFNMFNNGKVHVSTDKNTNDYGIHNDYCKALVKKYKSPSMELKKDTSEQLDDYEKLFEVYKVTDCNTAMEEAGITNGTGGVENESGFIGDWNVGKFVNRLHYWQANICEHNDNGKPARERSNGGKGGCGWCTGVTTRALRDSGFGNKYTNLEYPWDLYEKLKSGGDFVEIETSTSAPSNVEFTFGTPLHKGDICVMWKSGVRNKDVHYYHTCSFDGSVWYSDYKQNACNAYRKKSKVNLEWHLFRHK